MNGLKAFIDDQQTWNRNTIKQWCQQQQQQQHVQKQPDTLLPSVVIQYKTSLRYPGDTENAIWLAEYLETIARESSIQKQLQDILQIYLTLKMITCEHVKDWYYYKWTWSVSTPIDTTQLEEAGLLIQKKAQCVHAMLYGGTNQHLLATYLTGWQVISS